MQKVNSLTELPKNFYKNIPLPYRVIGNALYRVEKKLKGNQAEEYKILVARHAPIIKRELYNVEQPQVYYEIAWNDRGRLVVEIVGAGALATKREMIPLAEKGFPCNDNNYRQLIDYFDKVLALNQIDRGFMVERLGHIKNGFVHPQLPRNYEILPTDQGEKQLLEAFQVS